MHLMMNRFIFKKYFWKC